MHVLPHEIRDIIYHYHLIAWTDDLPIRRTHETIREIGQIDILYYIRVWGAHTSLRNIHARGELLTLFEYMLFTCPRLRNRLNELSGVNLMKLKHTIDSETNLPREYHAMKYLIEKHPDVAEMVLDMLRAVRAVLSIYPLIWG
jgi:hypothetical protein